jgi:Ca2+-binding EF-hand superfamily protein
MRIRSKLRDRYGSDALSIRRAKKAFENIDTNGDGRISPREFKNGMAGLRVDLTPDDAEAIIKHLDPGGTGKMDYKQFVDILGGVKPRVHKNEDDSSRRSRSPRRDNARVDAIVDRVRRKLEDSIGTGSATGRKIKEAFEDADRDGSHSIDRREFKKAMSFLGVDLSSGDLDDIYDKYDTQRDGRLDYSEFVELLGATRRNSSRNDRDRSPARSPRRDNARVDAIVDRVRRKLEDSIGTGSATGRKIKEAFEDADRDGSHSIDRREFKKAMSFLGVDLSSGDLDDIYDKYDTQRDGRLDYSEFVELLGASRASRRY